MQSLLEIQQAPTGLKLPCAWKYLHLELCFLILRMSCPRASPVNSGTYDIFLFFFFVYCFGVFFGHSVSCGTLVP